MVKKDIALFSSEIMGIMPHLIKGMFRRQVDALGKGIITIPQYLSLNIIGENSSIKMKDIASKLEISLPSSTGLISRLVKMGFVKRGYDENDRRMVYIVLTPKGRKILKEVKEQRRKAIEQVFGRLTEKERRSYLDILHKIMEILYPVRKSPSR